MLPASGDRVTAVAAHSGSEIGPVWPSVSVALEEVNWAVPKSVSGSGVQLLDRAVAL